MWRSPRLYRLRSALGYVTRTALTQMHNAGIPLRHIQEISGHNDLGTLQRYLEVSPEQKKQAVSVIGW